MGEKISATWRTRSGAAPFSAGEITHEVNREPAKPAQPPAGAEVLTGAAQIPAGDTTGEGNAAAGPGLRDADEPGWACSRSAAHFTRDRVRPVVAGSADLHK